MHGHSTLPIAGVVRTWLVVSTECIWLSSHRIGCTKSDETDFCSLIVSAHMWEGSQRSFGRFSVHHCGLPRNPVAQPSAFQVVSHVTWSRRLSSRPRQHFAGNYMMLPIPFTLISSNHGTTRQCNRSEDQKAVPRAATPRSFIRFLLQYSTDQQRETPSRHQEGTKTKPSSTKRPFGPLD